MGLLPCAYSSGSGTHTFPTQLCTAGCSCSAHRKPARPSLASKPPGQPAAALLACMAHSRPLTPLPPAHVPCRAAPCCALVCTLQDAMQAHLEALVEGWGDDFLDQLVAGLHADLQVLACRPYTYVCVHIRPMHRAYVGPMGHMRACMYNTHTHMHTGTGTCTRAHAHGHGHMHAGTCTRAHAPAIGGLLAVSASMA